MRAFLEMSSGKFYRLNFEYPYIKSKIWKFNRF